jgi:hypothetical protein
MTQRRQQQQQQTFYVGPNDGDICPMRSEGTNVGPACDADHAAKHVGWYVQEVGTHYAEDGSCHPDCGPIVRDPSDIRGQAPLLDVDGDHAHESEQDGRCWHESWCEPRGPFATEVEALADVG